MTFSLFLLSLLAGGGLLAALYSCLTDPGLWSPDQ